MQRINVSTVNNRAIKVNETEDIYYIDKFLKSNHSHNDVYCVILLILILKNKKNNNIRCQVIYA